MVEYIEREATCRDCFHYDVCDYHITEMTTMTVNECAHKFVNKADVVEVRHGVWEWYVEPRYDLYSCDENFGYRCSECKVWAGEYGVDDDIYEEPPTKILHYCPNCGAKMERGDD